MTPPLAASIHNPDLRALQPEKDFFVGVDSDGCVFDSMELKHKECFCPAFINHYGLQAVSRYARETWEFVNLYSKTRGLNRFKAVLEAIRLLNARPEVQEQLGKAIDIPDLENWISLESSLSAKTLEVYLNEKGEAFPDDNILHQSLRWSNDVAEAVERIVHDLPPIAEAVTTLQKISDQADCLVVSQTPSADLIREWQEHDITRYTRSIAGQEQGTKAEHLAQAAGSKYAPGHVLMVGDAPGDYQAAADNEFLFFPIIPGKETSSWKELHDHGLNRFFGGTYAGAYQDKVMDEFNRSLPDQPPWN
jgi:phosphoglycolate phosphatase-like HAD superfamily hydrolase